MYDVTKSYYSHINCYRLYHIMEAHLGHASTKCIYLFSKQINIFYSVSASKNISVFIFPEQENILCCFPKQIKISIFVFTNENISVFVFRKKKSFTLFLQAKIHLLLLFPSKKNMRFCSVFPCNN